MKPQMSTDETQNRQAGLAIPPVVSALTERALQTPRLRVSAVNKLYDS